MWYLFFACHAVKLSNVLKSDYWNQLESPAFCVTWAECPLSSREFGFNLFFFSASFVADTDSLELLHIFESAKLFRNSISWSILATKIWLRLAPGWGATTASLSTWWSVSFTVLLLSSTARKTPQNVWFAPLVMPIKGKWSSGGNAVC